MPSQWLIGDIIHFPPAGKIKKGFSTGIIRDRISNMYGTREALGVRSYSGLYIGSKAENTLASKMFD